MVRHFQRPVRWDGVAFTVFDKANTPALPVDTITALSLDSRGRMWVGTSHGVVVRDGAIWSAVPLPGAHNNDWNHAVVSLIVRADGEVLAAAWDGSVYATRDGVFEALPAPPGEMGKRYAGGVDEAGNWWVAQHRFIGKWDGTRWVETVAVPPGLAAESAGCGAARDGGLWILTGHELRRMRKGVEVSRTALPDFKSPASGLHEDSRGQVWISSASGLWRVRPADGSVRHWTSQNGLTVDPVYFTFEDREHNVWAGTSRGGLMRFKQRVFRSFLDVAGRREPVRFVVAAHPDGGVLMAQYGRPLMRADAAGVTPFPLPPPLAGMASVIRSLLVEKTGRLWIGTLGNGVWMIHGQATRHLSPQEAGTDVSTLFADSRGRIWMAGGTAVAVFENDAVRGFGAAQGLPAGSVTAFAEDKSGTVWAAYEHGLFRLEGGRFAEVKDDGGAPLSAAGMLGDADGGVWIGGFHHGLRLWKDGRLLHRQLPPELSLRGVWSFTDDGAGFLWMATPRGVLRAPLAELRAWMAHGSPGPAFQLFGMDDGLPGLEFASTFQQAAARDSQGRLWFPLSKGVAMTDPAALTLNTLPPPVQIQSVIHFGASGEGYGGSRGHAASAEVQTVLHPPFADNVAFPPGSRRLEIGYAALSFAAQEMVRYQISLTPGGRSAAWQDAAAQRTATYYDLPPGGYTFRVRAANNDGVWNETGAALAFTVQPFFWQTTGFRVAGGLLLICFGGGFTWWLLRFRHARMAEKLELQQQRNEVAHLSRVTTLGEISGSLAHELNQPLGAILANTEAAELHLQNESPDLDEVRSILADIRKDDMRAGDIIHGMRAFLRRRELEMQPLPVDQLITETVKMIGSDAASRNTTIGIHLEPGLPRITGEHIHLQQVLLNLMVNGMDAMSLIPLADRHLTIRAARRDDDTIEIIVSDAGSGIPAGDLSDIFKPFHTSKRGGLGLGLAICRSIIEAHGGSISLSNNPERGATVQFSLRVAGRGGEGRVISDQ